MESILNMNEFLLVYLKYFCFFFYLRNIHNYSYIVLYLIIVSSSEDID
jgi:hypothetical protein